MAAKPHRTVGREEALDEVASFRLDVRWKLIIAVQDLLVDAKGIVVVEGRVSSQHFENEHAKRPPVYVLVMALALNDLRRQVLRCST